MFFFTILDDEDDETAIASVCIHRKVSAMGHNVHSLAYVSGSHS